MPRITNNMPREYKWCWWICHGQAVAYYFSMCVVTAFMAWQQICLFQVFYVRLHEASSGQVLPILQVCAKPVSGKTSLNALCGNSWMCWRFFSPRFPFKTECYRQLLQLLSEKGTACANSGFSFILRTPKNLHSWTPSRPLQLWPLPPRTSEVSSRCCCVCQSFPVFGFPPHAWETAPSFCTPCFLLN